MQRTVLRFADILVAVMHWDCTVRGVQGNALSRIQVRSADWLDYTYWSVEGGGGRQGGGREAVQERQKCVVMIVEEMLNVDRGLLAVTRLATNIPATRIL